MTLTQSKISRALGANLRASKKFEARFEMQAEDFPPAGTPNRKSIIEGRRSALQKLACSPRSIKKRISFYDQRRALERRWNATLASQSEGMRALSIVQAIIRENLPCLSGMDSRQAKFAVFSISRGYGLNNGKRYIVNPDKLR